MKAAKRPLVAAPIVPVAPAPPVSVAAKLGTKLEQEKHTRTMLVARIRGQLETFAANATHALARLDALAEKETICERPGTEPVPFDGDRKAHAIADSARFALDGVMHRATSFAEAQRDLTETMRRIDLLEGLEEHAAAVAAYSAPKPAAVSA